MWAPQFTIRRLLLITALCCVFFFTVSMARQGHNWAIALALVGAAVIISFLVYAFLFFTAWLFSVLLYDLARKPEPRSPFAQHTPPPQIVMPDEPE